MFVFLALIAFWPTPVDQPASGQLAIVLQFVHSHGVPGWFNYKFVEASANIALFFPLGFVSSLAFTRKRLWQLGAFSLLVSGSIELGQLLFLHNRFASLSDVVMNTVGATIGALLATTLKRPQDP
ncbi:VanZ family protein [Pseudarthrobacter sp. SL88]|nr:VanZ family protein [Pseudarthrobacter sp. SL88]